MTRFKNSIAVLLGILILSAGCGGGSGGGNPNPDNLTQAQAQQVASSTLGEVYYALDATLSATENVASSSRSHLAGAMANVRHRVVPFATTETTCTNTSCTLSYTYTCTEGGSIAVTGTLTETSNTSARGNITMVPSSCSDGTLVLDGNPHITISIDVSDNGTTTTSNLAFGGNVSFSPVTKGDFPAGSCGWSIKGSVSQSDSSDSESCSVSGSVCGLSFRGSCP